MAATPGRFWPTNLRRQLLEIIGIDQPTQGYVAAIDRQVNRALQGMSGHQSVGFNADPAYRWKGYTDYRTLANTTNGGASQNYRGNPNVALPATNGPVVVVSASPVNNVMAALAATPPGFR